MRKVIMVLTVLLLCCSMVFAGGKKESAANQKAAEEPVTLRIAWWGSQTRHDRTLAVLDLYTQLTGVQFEAEFLPFDGYFTKLNTLCAANDVYDIIQLGGNFPTYADYLEDLDPYIKSGIIDVSGTSEGILSTTRLNGNGPLLGISSGTNTYGVAYDPALFQKAGVAEPTENWTWKEYEAACLKIHEKLGIFGCSKFDDINSGGSQRIPQHAKGQELFATGPEGPYLGYTDDYPIIDYFTIRKNLVDAGAYPDPGRINEIKDIEGDYLVRGEAAMTYVASNQFVALCNAAGRPLKLATLPRENATSSVGVSMQSSQMFGVYNGSKYKEEAAKFLSFFANSLEANRILLGERGIPIMEAVRTDLQSSSTDAAQNELYSFITVMSRNSEVVLQFDVPQQAEIKDLYNRVLDQVVYGKITPTEGAKQFRTEANAIFDKTK